MRLHPKSIRYGSILTELMGACLLAGFGCPGTTPPPPANVDPVADAGPDQNVEGGEDVTLDGRDSADADGDPLSFSWNQTAGADVGDLADNASPTFTAPDQAGALVFQLTVTDGNGGTDTDSVTVNVSVGGDNDNGNVNVNDNVNEAPTADAGGDQTVEPGAAVTLDGSASTDPDGDDLTFAWVQTPASTVTLTGENTDTATFTAPDDEGTLTFELTVDDGNGGTDTDTVNVTVESTAEPRLFIANFTGDSVIHYANPSTVNGNISPVSAGGGNLQGAQTLLNDPADIVVNGADELLAANFTGNTITTYENAAEVNGNQEPDGNVAGAATLLVDPVTLAINTGEDLLFVADLNGAGASRILVFSETTGTFNGNLPPIRTISSGDLNEPLGINFGANDDLYVANNSVGADNVLVFANASNLNGTVAATRIITNAEFDTIFDVFIDGNDTMFVVDSTDDEIYTFNNADSLNGAEQPDFTLTVPGAGTLTAIAVDSNDVGYIVDFTGNAVFSYDDVSTLNGALGPDRTIAGGNTLLNGPIRVFLTE